MAREQTATEQSIGAARAYLYRLAPLFATNTTHSHDFFVKDDYVRIVVEIKARELLGELWPGKWHSMPMLADMLTPIVGWIVSPNSLWRTMNKIEKFKDEINRRVTQLRK